MTNVVEVVEHDEQITTEETLAQIEITDDATSVVEISEESVLVETTTEIQIIETSAPISTILTEEPTIQIIELAETGPQGPPGPPGPGGNTFVFDQSVAASHWDVVHNLGFYPNVTVVDSAGTEVEGNVVYINANELTIDFNSPFAGQAFLS